MTLVSGPDIVARQEFEAETINPGSSVWDKIDQRLILAPRADTYVNTDGDT